MAKKRYVHLIKAHGMDKRYTLNKSTWKENGCTVLLIKTYCKDKRCTRNQKHGER